jgi:hypothetical protein
MNGYLQMKARNTVKIGLKDEFGNEKKDENGNLLYIEFDLEDIELPLKYNKCEFLIRKAKQDLKFDLLIINKRQDVKGKYLLSKNEEDRIKATKKYYKTMEEAMDLFLGEGAVNKIFGKKRYYEMFDDLAEQLEPILPLLSENLANITKMIPEKYANEADDILKA